MTSVEQRINMYHLASSVIAYGVRGDFVELGCHSGLSAALFQTVIEQYDPTRSLHVYDSFEGLPGITPQDGSTPVGAGDMSTTEDVLFENFAAQNLKPPTIHKGWFSETLPEGLPDRIAFAHLDGDLYDSTIVSLQHVYPRLVPGAVCLIDDYSDVRVFDSIDLFPGVKVACDEYLADKPERVSLLYGGYDIDLGFGSHGFFRKM